MHLSELPTIFVKGGEECKVYFTVQANELRQQGWLPKQEAEKAQQAEVVKEPTRKETTAKSEAVKVDKKTSEEIKIDG